mgnify:CR=1 FL=1
MSEKFFEKYLAHSTTLSANGEQSRIHWQKLFESDKELMADELFLPFSRNFSTNAERMNNIIKSLYKCYPIINE